MAAERPAEDRASASHVVYLDREGLRTAALLSVSERKCRVADSDGTRHKIGRERVAAFAASGEEALGIALRADALGAEIDMEDAWRAAGGERLDPSVLAARVLPGEPGAERTAALRLAQSRQRAFFVEQKDGTLAPVDGAQREKVAGSIERRRERSNLEREWTAELDAGGIPEVLRACLERHLRTGEGRNDHDLRFLKGHCLRKGTSLGLLALSCGIFGDMEELHLCEVLRGSPPPRKDLAAGPVVPGELGTVAQGALSVDGEDTSEIDDAFFLAGDGGGEAEVTVCIAAPGLGIDSEAELQASERMVTLYLPGEKREMLPAGTVSAYSLSAPGKHPTVALTTRTGRDGSVSGTGFRIGGVDMAANVTLEGFGPEGFSHPDLGDGESGMLAGLQSFCKALGIVKPRDPGQRGHIVKRTENGVSVVPRSGFADADDLVAALMIHYNNEAAAFLAAAGVPFLGRRDGRLVVAAGKGADVGYGWFTSPLRRIIDLVNQRQLIAALRGLEPPADAGGLRGLASRFDRKYERSRTNQRRMERFWCLRELEGRVGEELPARVSRMAGRAWLDGLPVAVGIDPSGRTPGERVNVRIDAVDTYELSVRGSVA